MRPLRLKFIILGLFCLVGCTQNPQPLGKPLPSITYENLIPFTAYGGAVQIRQSFKPDKRTLMAMKDFPLAPDQLLKKYAGHRFVTQGSPVKMVFNIERAALLKTTEEENIIGYLSGAAEDIYRLDIFLTMSPVRADGSLKEPFTVSLKRELLIPQRTSLAERETLQFEFLEKAVHDIDKIISDFVTQSMR